MLERSSHAGNRKTGKFFANYSVRSTPHQIFTKPLYHHHTTISYPELFPYALQSEITLIPRTIGLAGGNQENAHIALSKQQGDFAVRCTYSQILINRKKHINVFCSTYLEFPLNQGRLSADFDWPLESCSGLHQDVG
ncbi:hypothetical protein GJ744_004057 [Endocarpon pusillum]|uniref:Uncharacterized protein n=1 Tax=Endocarpon pusillum TaxID=364733 RepID=A0A8H7DXR2_9EURO|nr:hypothetical protein GJ744_004057 [Endocarpon pusillum]